MTSFDTWLDEMTREVRDLVGTPADRIQQEVVHHCSNCENGGWECYGLGFGDPHFRVCKVCGNPNDYPSP